MSERESPEVTIARCRALHDAGEPPPAGWPAPRETEGMAAIQWPNWYGSAKHKAAYRDVAREAPAAAVERAPTSTRTHYERCPVCGGRTCAHRDGSLTPEQEARAAELFNEMMAPVVVVSDRCRVCGGRSCAHLDAAKAAAAVELPRAARAVELPTSPMTTAAGELPTPASALDELPGNVGAASEPPRRRR